MLHLQELRLRNYALFADQSFTFEPGLTVIGGRNRVGKSLLFSALRPLLFNVASGEHLPKGSHVELDTRLTRTTGKGARMTIIADSPKGKPDWTLHVNGQDMQTHRKRSVRELIDRNITLTEDLFDSTCHLSISPRSLPLMHGTPAAKLDWLASVFNLSETYSRMEELVSEKLKQLTKDEVRLEVLTKSLHELPEKPDIARLEKLQKRHTKIKAKIAIWSEKNRLLQEQSALKSLLKALKKRKTSHKRLSDLQEAADKVERQLKRAEEQKSLQEAYDLALREYKSLERRRNDILEALPKKYRVANGKQADMAIEGLTGVANDLRLKLDRRAELEAKSKAFLQDKAQLKALKKPTFNAEEAEYRLREAEEAGVSARATLSNLKKTAKQGRACPHCGSSLDKKHVHSLQSKYEAQLNKARAEYKIANDAIKYYELRERTKFLPEALDFTVVEERYARVTKLLKLLNAYIDTLEVSKPEKPKQLKDINVKKLRVELEALQSDIHLFEAHGKDRFPPVHEVEERLEELAAQLGDLPEEGIEQLSDQAIEVGETINSMKLTLKAHTMATQHNEAISEEITALKKRVRAVRPLRALKDAFGRSGVMLSSMNDVIEHLVQEINALAPMLLDEKWRVEIVTGPRKLNVMVERNGKNESLRTISTSEQRCWTLLFATAMLRILPNSMLTDTIILDEMESNMDAVSRKRYATEFLPFIQTIVPKVIVVTPQISGELVMQPDRVFRVEKQNNTSSLRQIA